MRPWWNEPPPGFTTTGTVSSSVPSGAAERGPASQSSGAWNSRSRRRRLRPRVRAADELDRAGVRLRLVQRDPARDHLRRDEVVGVRRVLVEADRLRSWRFPENVVLEDPDAAVAGELGGEAARPLGEHLRRDDGVRLPGVAELPGAILGVAAGNPVHLVRPDPGLVLAVEEGDVALPEQLEPALGDETILDDEEAVLPKASTCSAVNASSALTAEVWSSCPVAPTTSALLADLPPRAGTEAGRARSAPTSLPGHSKHSLPQERGLVFSGS